MGLNTINHPGQRLITGLTALGVDQPSAFPLVGGTAFHEFTTVASGTGAVLPSSRLPITATISNAGANTIAIYPPLGGTIDGGSVNAAATLATGKSGTYWAAGPLTWYSVVSAVGGGGGGSGTVTSITAGTGLSGGTVTTTGTFSLATIPTLDVLANTTGGTAAPAGVTLSALIDAAIGSTQGDLLYRDSAAWQVLAPGTSGYVLASQGAAANPHWIAAGGTGTVTSASVVTANGVSASVATATTTPAFTFTLAAITPTTIVASGAISGSNLSLGGTLTTAGAVTVSGAFGTTLSVTATTSVTLPTSGTLVNSAVATLSSLVSIGTVTTGTWNATPVVPAYGGTGLATLTAHAVLVGEGTGNVAFATVGTSGRPLIDQGGSADPAFLATGVKIDSHFGVITVDTVSAGSVTVNLATSDKHSITLVNGTPTAIVLSNPTVGQVFTLRLIQDGTGSCTVGTWFTTIKWAGGSAPTLTATAGKTDVVTFLCTGSGTYDGFVVGLNL